MSRDTVGVRQAPKRLRPLNRGRGDGIRHLQGKRYSKVVANVDFCDTYSWGSFDGLLPNSPGLVAFIAFPERALDDEAPRLLV